MDIEVKLPELGEDAPDEATLSFFFFEVGEDVTEGDDLAELYTDKATFNMPSPATGTVKELLVKEEEVVKVGQPMAILEGA